MPKKKVTKKVANKKPAKVLSRSERRRIAMQERRK